MAEFWDVLDENGSKTGRLHERGKELGFGVYHLVVYVWILDKEGNFLIAKRTPNKSFPNMWGCVSGNAVAGDDSLTTALKEVREELGVELEIGNGEIFRQFKRFCQENKNGAFVDVWIFRQEVDIATIEFQPDETCDAMWASKAKIMEMISAGIFITEWYPYIEEILSI